ncbi:MAG: hypothetical protein QM791_02145 [Ferruginibacter sp.]
MLLKTFVINEPITNTFEPAQSVLPERFRSITEPVSYPIAGSELASATDDFFPLEEIIDE